MRAYGRRKKISFCFLSFIKQRHYITIFEKPFRKIKTHEHKVPLIAPVFLDEMHLSDNSLEAVLEPLDGLALGDLVVGTDMSLSAATLGDTLTRTGPILVSSSPCRKYYILSQL